jgi:hypothetical protein
MSGMGRPRPHTQHTEHPASGDAASPTKPESMDDADVANGEGDPDEDSDRQHG